MTIAERATVMSGIMGLLVWICLGLVAPSVARASDYDGSKNLHCAATDAIQCEGAGECERTEVEALNLPKFIHIDFKAKKLRGTVEGRDEEETTPIQNIQKLDGQTVIQGVQNGRGWSIVVDGGTGDITAAVAGDDLAFVLFGVCHTR